MKRTNWNRLRRVRTRRSYSGRELARVLDVHPRTIQTWRKIGLMPIEGSSNPLLYLGEEIKRFLSRKRNESRRPLEIHQFYCAKCKKAAETTLESLDWVYTGKRIGRVDESVIVKGRCTCCGTSLSRFSTKSGLERVLDAMMGKAHQSGLEGIELPASITDIEGERKPC